MKVIVLLCLCAAALAEDYLDTVVHDYHYQTLGADVVKAHMKCFLDEGPCDEVAESFKKVIPEAFKTKCERCSDGQKKTAWLFLTSVHDIIPAELEKFKKKYDPDNKYFDDVVAAVKPKDKDN